MGHGFAQVFAVNRRDVMLTDRTADLAEAGKEMIAANLETVVAEGFLDPAELDSVLDRIETTGDLGEAVSEADFVLEAVGG